MEKIDERKFLAVCEEVVNREVLCNVGGLVDELNKHDALEDQDLFGRPLSYWDCKCENCGYVWVTETEHLPLHPSDCPKCGCGEIESENVDGGEYEEVYEYWAVSRYFARLLKESGEIVEMDFFGLCVWGRQCTGQAIFLDGVIKDIVKQRGINKNDWINQE